MGNIIEISHVTKFYGRNRGIEDVSLGVPEGEIFGFLGPNGAGKSTTIRTMLGLISPDRGEIRVFGKDARANKEEVLKDIGYMSSEVWFYPGMTVKDVLKFAANVRGVDCTDEAERICEKLELDAKRKVHELSLGNRKKVGIVAAMQHKPKLFVFDEPTSGLDPLMQISFFELVREYVDAGATCLLSTHVLSEVRNYCDSVAIMREGRMVISDSVEHLMESKSKRIKMIRDGEHLDFIYKDDLNNLYKELQGHDIKDILIEEPSIEEVFMQYYERRGL